MIPLNAWFQHFNGSGNQPARYIVDRSVKEGGTQIEYEDEDPKIRQHFEAELAKHGLKSRMT